MPEDNIFEVIIIGAGIGGLSLGQKLQKQSVKFKILESHKIGGVIDQISVGDHIIPKGPRIFLHSRSEKLLELASELNVPYKIIDQPMPRYLFTEKGLKKVGPWLFLKYPKIFNVFLSAITAHEESIREFFQSRVGSKFVDEIIDPICSGVWAEEPSKLSMDALMGDLKNKHFFKKKKKGLIVFPKGLYSLIAALEEVLKLYIECKSPVQKIFKTEEGWEIKTETAVFKARHVVIATSFHEMKHLTNSLTEYHEFDLETMGSANIDVVSFSFSKKLSRPFGSGYLIPRNRGFKTRGVLFDADFVGINNQDLLSVFIHDAKDPIKTAFGELKSILKFDEPYENAFHTVYPHHIFTCQKGCFLKLEGFKKALSEKNLHLLGAYPKVGVPDVLANQENILQVLEADLKLESKI